MKERTALSMQLYDMLLERGYHESLCDAITKNLNTDYTQAKINEIYECGLGVEEE